MAIRKSKIAERALIQRNFELGSIFDIEVANNDELFEAMPEDSVVVMLPEDDPELCEYNRWLYELKGNKSKPVVWARMNRAKGVVLELQVEPPEPIP